MENFKETKQEETPSPQSSPTPQPTPSLTPQPSPKRSYLLIGVITAIIVLIGGVGILVLLTQKDIPQIPKVTSPGTIVQNETASWQTYRNEIYGFEFRYPSALGEEETTTEWSNGGRMGRIFDIGSSDSNQSYSFMGAKIIYPAASGRIPVPWVPYPCGDTRSTENARNIEIDGIDFVRFEDRDVGSSLSRLRVTVNYFAKYRDVCFHFSYYAREGDEHKINDAELQRHIDQFDAIASTLHIIEDELRNDWITFRDNEHKFEFKYPPNLIREEKESEYPLRAHNIGPQIIKLVFPPGSYQDTKVRDGFISIHARPEQDEKQCLSKALDESPSDEFPIDGVIFYRDGIGGILGSSESYQTLHKEICYAINIRTSHEGTVTEEVSVVLRDFSNVLQQILSTFRFIE